MRRGRRQDAAGSVAEQFRVGLMPYRGVGNIVALGGVAVGSPVTRAFAETARRLEANDVAEELLTVACERAGVRLLAHRRRSVHHRVGRSVSQVFEARIQTGGETRDVLLVAHADLRGLPDGALVLERGDDRVAVWRFPHDPYLPGLPSAIDAPRVRELLDHVGAPSGALRLRTRAYRPSRRAVVEVTVTNAASPRRVLYLKVLSGARATTLADHHRQLAAHVPVPRVIGVAETQGIVALEALPGHTLRDAVAEGAPVPEPAELLDLSHRLQASGLASDRSPRDFANPTRHVDLLCELAPEAAPTVRRVADEASRVEGAACVVHGDFHAGQVLVDGGAIVGLLDVDGAGHGLLAHDAGTFVAYLQVLGELHPEARDRLETYAAAVADAYRPEIGAAVLARATAGAWLGLATAAHRSQEPDWAATTRRRIDRAAAALDEG